MRSEKRCIDTSKDMITSIELYKIFYETRNEHYKDFNDTTIMKDENFIDSLLTNNLNIFMNFTFFKDTLDNYYAELTARVNEDRVYYEDEDSYGRWLTPIPTSLEEKLSLINLDIYLRFMQSKPYDDKDEMNIKVLYYEYFNYIFHNDKLTESYREACEKYNKTFRETLTTNHLSICEYIFSKRRIAFNKIDQLLHYAFYGADTDYVEIDRKYNKKNSLMIPTIICPCYIILLTMFDINSNFFSIIKKQDWNQLSSYDREFLLSILYYITNGNKAYKYVVEKLSDSTTVKLKNKFQIVLEKIDCLDDNNDEDEKGKKTEAAEKLLRILDSFEKRYLNNTKSYSSIEDFIQSLNQSDNDTY